MVINIAQTLLIPLWDWFQYVPSSLKRKLIMLTSFQRPLGNE